MDPSQIIPFIDLIGAAVGLFDKVADEVARFITKEPDTPRPKEWQYKIQREDHKLVVRQDGREMQTITGDQLKNLPAAYYQHIQVYENAMQAKYRLWQKVYPKRNATSDELVNAKIDEQIRNLILDMKGDLVGIVNFLQSIGVQLDDHYMQIRDLVQQYDGSVQGA